MEKKGIVKEIKKNNNLPFISYCYHLKIQNSIVKSIVSVMKEMRNKILFKVFLPGSE